MKQIGDFSLFVVCCFCFSILQAQVVNYALKLSGIILLFADKYLKLMGKVNMLFNFNGSTRMDYCRCLYF